MGEGLSTFFAVLDIDTSSTFANISKYLSKTTCSSCGGLKLNADILDIRILNYNISEVENLPFEELLEWIEQVKKYVKKMASKEQMEQLIFDISRRIQCLMELKL